MLRGNALQPSRLQLLDESAGVTRGQHAKRNAVDARLFQPERRHHCRRQWNSGPEGSRSVIVPSTADGVAQSAENHQDETHHEHDHSDRPDDGYMGDEPDDEKYQAKGDHESSKTWTLRISGPSASVAASTTQR